MSAHSSTNKLWEQHQWLPLKMEEGFLGSSDRRNKGKCSSSGAVCVVLSTSFSTKPSTIWKTAVEREATLLSLSCRLHLEENTIVPLASSVPRDTKKALSLSYHVSKRHRVSSSQSVLFSFCSRKCHSPLAVLGKLAGELGSC